MLEAPPENREEENSIPKSKRHRKDKPWDNESIDHWHIDPFKPGEMDGALLEESSFSTLFPKYREQYLKDHWEGIALFMKSEYGIEATLDLIAGSMAVKTTRKTWDPYAIIKARDMLRLLSRSVNFDQAKKIMSDEMHCDIIKIDGFTKSKETDKGFLDPMELLSKQLNYLQIALY